MDRDRHSRQPSCRNRPVDVRRSVDIFTGWWLQSFGYALAATFLLYFIILYRAGTWIVNSNGLPIYRFRQRLGGRYGSTQERAALYDRPSSPRSTRRCSDRRLSPTRTPYPPTYFLILAFCGIAVSLGVHHLGSRYTNGCIAVVYLIVRRWRRSLWRATPFTAWNFLAAQNGFDGRAARASLLLIERRPLAAGIFIGLLSYKPQFGILSPVALVASGQWRAIAGAAATIVFLGGVSIAAFGAGAWAAFPGQLAAQTGVSLLSDPGNGWGYIQTVYGLIRSLHGGAALAWLAQGSTTLGAAVIVWLVWRSSAAYPIKAAILSGAALLATPYAFAYDMAAIVIPAAFLASDQLTRGLLRGDKAMWIALFGAPLAVLVTQGDNVGGPTFGGMPVSLFAAILLLSIILRRATVARPIATLSH